MRRADTPSAAASVAREFGLAALSHIGMAAAGNDARIAHQYHEDRAVHFAKRAAHYARVADPSLKEDR